MNLSKDTIPHYMDLKKNNLRFKNPVEDLALNNVRVEGVFEDT